MEKIDNHQPVKSLSEFLESLLSKIKNFEKNEIIWFRGESSDQYSLVPNIYRKARKGKTVYCQDIIDTNKFNILEANVDTSFYRKSSLYFSNNGIENNVWNRYFLKQHYGVKTRLLDWTDNALFALFFALYDSSDINSHARVWMLSPFTLNNYSVGKLHSEEKTFYKIITLSDFEKEQDLVSPSGEIRIAELGRKYYRMDCRNGEKLYPLAIYPPHLDQRMAVQQSCFTLFGNIVTGLNCNDSSERFLEFIDIDANYKRSVLTDLKSLGISSYSIFPDMDGLGRSINEAHAYDISRSQENSDLDAFLTEVE